MNADGLAYVTALIISFADQMGTQFTVPVVVPYGRYMGASLDTIALFTTVRGVCAFVSTLWMPRLSDKRGRKFVLMISLSGCSLGYLLQGASSMTPQAAGIALFMVGRGVAGFCSAGTQPILRAYLTELSSGSHEVLKRRLTEMQAASQAAGIVLKPIAGAVAKIGLAIPFFVCFGVLVLGTIWTCFTFREVSEVRAMTGLTQPLDSEPSPGEARPQQDTAPHTEEEEEDQGNPVFDKVIFLCFTGHLAVYVLVTAIPFLLPVMLSRPSFGLLRDTDEETQGEIAAASGIITVPFALCSVLVSLMLYLPITRRVGEVPVLLVAGISASVSFGSYGFWIHNLWQLCLCQSFGGFCFGLLLPAASPLVARYASVHYSKKIAACQAIAMLGIQISRSFAQNLMAAILRGFGDQGERICWIICGVCVLLCTICLAIGVRLVEKRAARANALSSQQRKVLLTAAGNTELSAAQECKR